MKIRAQLILAFVLLAVVPLAGIVLYSYYSSQRAVRQTVEEEAEALTAEMDQRLTLVKQELRDRVLGLEQLPLNRLFSGEPSEDDKAEVLGWVLDRMGATAGLIESFEIETVPEPPVAEAAPPFDDTETLDQPPDAPEPPRVGQPAPIPNSGASELETVVLHVTEDLRSRYQEMQRRGESLEINPEEGIRYGLEVAAVLAEAFAREIGESIDEETDTTEQATEHEEALVVVVEEAESLALEELREIEAELEKTSRQQLQEVLAAAEAEKRAVEHRLRVERRAGRLELGGRFDVRQGTRTLRIQPRISAERLLHQVLALTRRDQGEIPFARDADGELYVIEETDRDILDRLPLGTSGISEDWVITSSMDPETGVEFGIVRPISEPLAEVRQAAARNFGYGMGLILVALVGILPLSGRMTRDLKVLTLGAEKIADGDLDTRVPVRSNDEFGQLANTFNRMARDLRLRRDQEVEYERKSRELQEAREFQLSLLPRDLPTDPSFEIAVHMQTATEVGGDYYDFDLAEDGTLTVAVGDATGHGARAGTMVTVVKSLFSAYASGSGLRRFLIGANRTIRRMDLGRMSMTLVLAELRRGGLTLSSAGMPPALIHRAKSGAVDEVTLEGMPLGGLEFDYREERVDLAAGDTVLLMTDGLPELLGADGEVLGYETARELFARAASQPPKEVVSELADAVSARTGGKPPNDDVTFVVIKAR